MRAKLKSKKLGGAVGNKNDETIPLVMNNNVNDSNRTRRTTSGAEENYIVDNNVGVADRSTPNSHLLSNGVAINNTIINSNNNNNSNVNNTTAITVDGNTGGGGALYAPHHQHHHQDHHNHTVDSNNTTMGRSRSSSSSNDGTSSLDNATPPALGGAGCQQNSVFGAPASLSHYGSGLAALGAGLRAPSSVGSNLRRYQCKLCPLMFDSKAELQIHTQVHMREAKPYKCSHCPKSFANSSYLSQHMRIHLGIKPFGPCQYCGRKFTQLSHLQQHLRTHTGDKPYKCRFMGCEKAFSQLSNLQSHSRCHQSDKPFKCNSCYKCFTDEQTLLEHIPKHKESKHLKVHICPYCGKSYTQATYLAKHMTKHSDRKPMKNVLDDHAWTSRDNAVCGGGAATGITEPCGETTPTNALSFNSFQHAHNHMIQSQNCAYTSGIASSMAAASMSAAAAADPSAFTRLAGLAPLSGRLTAASTRNPYGFAYDNFKPNAHSAGLGHHSASYNQFIRLDDIRSYAGQAAAAASAEHFNMLMKRDPRETAY